MPQSKLYLTLVFHRSKKTFVFVEKYVNRKIFINIDKLVLPLEDKDVLVNKYKIE